MQSSHGNWKSRCRGSLLAFLGSLALFLAGCPGPDDPRNGPAGPTEEAPSLRLGVVDDPAIVQAVELLGGEWNAQTGSELQVVALTREELTATDNLPVDALIGPSSLLGLLAQRELVAPVPRDLLRGDATNGDAAGWGEVFELPKLREVAWGTDVMGLSFGSPVLTVYYRADLLEKLGRRPPNTWDEYGKLAALLAESGETESWQGTIEPLAPGWAGLTLLARAASYAKHPDNYSTLFDISTMEPLIAGPPFQRALEELVAANGSSGDGIGTEEILRHDPTSAREALWQGRCGMAMTWPTAAAELADAEELRIAIAELPGSNDVYDLGSDSMQRRTDDEDRRVPLLAIAGRIGLVSEASPAKEHAFQLLVWLSGDRFGTQVCSASPATTLFRRSQKKTPTKWTESTLPVSEAAAYAELTETTFRRQQWLTPPRIPARDEYLTALDLAVREAVAGEVSPAEALEKAADRWREITERIGVERQKTAYRRSLGLP